MRIEQFVPKSQTQLEAVKFTGGIDNGREIMAWIINAGGMAEWREEDHGDWNRCGMREHIRIIKGGGTRYAYVGDFIFKDETTGDFKAQKKVAFESQYICLTTLDNAIAA